MSQQAVGRSPGTRVTGGGRETRRASPTILALVDQAGDDARVVGAARTLSHGLGATIVLLHVGRPVSYHERAPWEPMATIEAAAHDVLRRLAARLLPPSIYSQTAVRFGNTVEQVRSVAAAVDATVVVASSKPARWLPWRSRDRALRGSLDIPVILVAARGGDRDVGGPDHRPGVIEPCARPAAQHVEPVNP